MPIYGITVLSLIAVRLIGTTALGAQRWISIGPLHVQPSEFAKIAAILLVAAVWSSQGTTGGPLASAGGDFGSWLPVFISLIWGPRCVRRPDADDALLVWDAGRVGGLLPSPLATASLRPGALDSDVDPPMALLAWSFAMEADGLAITWLFMA